MGNCIRGDEFRWPNGEVLYVLGDDLDAGEPAAVGQAIAEWESSGAPVSFTEYKGPRAPFARETYAEFVPGNDLSSCHTVVGRRFPGQKVYCQLGANTLVHEIGHTLGLKHEQQRFDRDLHIAVLTDNIIASKRGNFERLPIEEAIPVGPHDFDSRMHYNENLFAVDFEVNLEIPRMGSPVAPGLAFFNGELHAVFTGENRNLFHAWTTDLVEWERQPIEGQSTKASPALVELSGDLVMIHLGRSSNNVWISRSSDGREFSKNEQIRGIVSRNTPAMAVHGGELHLAFIGSSDNEIRHSWSSTGAADDWKTPNPIDQTSKAGPALASDGTTLHLVHVGNSSAELWYSRSDNGRNWSQNERIGQQTKASPALAVRQGTLHLAHLGSSSNRVWHSVLSGTKFAPNRETNQLSRQQPSLTAGTLGATGLLVLSHIGDTSNRMYVSRYNPGLKTMVAISGTPSGAMGGNMLTPGDIAAVRFMYG